MTYMPFLTNLRIVLIKGCFFQIRNLGFVLLILEATNRITGFLETVAEIEYIAGSVAQAMAPGVRCRVLCSTPPVTVVSPVRRD
jgi:hypothetical protein